MNIVCRTLFDCTCTGITGHFRASQVPYKDKLGNVITSVEQWNRARNKHRNWETIMQVISLRAQPSIVREPSLIRGAWEFEFAVETPGVYSTNNDSSNLEALINECAGVPMVTGLDEASSILPTLVVAGPNQNLWFETINK